MITIFGNFSIGTFQEALSLAEASGYFLVFVAMTLEGPIMTSAAAFAASLGLFNVYAIFFLSLAGDLGGDLVHFFVGRMIKKRAVERYAAKLGINRKRIEKVEYQLSNRLISSMFVIKFTPILTNIGLLLAGALEVPFRRFIKASFFATLPRTFFFVCIGYYFGLAVSRVLDYFNIGQYLIPLLLVLLVGLYFGYRKIYDKITKNIGKI